MSFGSKAFTLIEVLISIAVASFIFLAISSTFYLLTRFSEKLDSKQENIKFYELLLTLQRGIYPAKDLSIKKDEDKVVVEFLTNYAFTNIFVRVRLVINDKEIIYRELIPYGKKILLEVKLKQACKLFHESTHLTLVCNKTTYIFPLKKQILPYFPFFEKRK